MANREPNRSALVDANPARPEPTHETLYDFEGGYSFTSSRVSFEGNIYYMLYKNQLVLTGRINDVGDPMLENVPDSYRTGIELSVGVWVFKFFNWTANIALSENKIMNFTEYIDNWDEYPQQIVVTHEKTDISFSPGMVANNIFAFEPVEDLTIKLISKYVSRQYTDNTSSSERSLDPYFLNDLFIGYSMFPSFVKEISFSFKVNNIFDEKYETNAWVYRYYSEGSNNSFDGFFPQAGINFLGGMTIVF